MGVNPHYEVVKSGYWHNCHKGRRIYANQPARALWSSLLSDCENFGNGSFAALVLWNCVVDEVHTRMISHMCTDPHGSQPWVYSDCITCLVVVTSVSQHHTVSLPLNLFPFIKPRNESNQLFWKVLEKLSWGWDKNCLLLLLPLYVAYPFYPIFPTYPRYRTSPILIYCAK